MASSLASGSFWIDLGERTVRSFAQGTLAGAGLSLAGVAAPVMSVPWLLAVQVGATTAGICFLTGLAGATVGDDKTASFLPPPTQTPAKLRALLRKTPH